MDQPKPRFVIPASEAESMAQSSGVTLPDLLPSLVPQFQSLARAPISNFHVAAVGVGSSGRIFIGVNIEFPGLPFHHTVHAEQFLLTNLLLNSEPHLHSFAVSAAPCGHCRQFLQEIRHAKDINLLITSHKNPTYTPLSHILPHHFGPCDLLPDEVPLLLDPRNHNLKLSSSQETLLPNGSVFCEKLRIAALKAANVSHAPYSASPSGVAIVDCRGKVYKGSYIESAAYNPSLGPLQAALVAFVSGGGGGYEEIVEAVLVEKEDAVVKQEDTVRLLLKSISPQCQFKVFLCTS